MTEPAGFEDLRRRAEAAIVDKRTMAPQEVKRLLHELRLHQLELERQNEELRRTQLELTEARDRYFELFDLSPIAYLTITADGVVTDVNLAAAQLLGNDRLSLVHSRLSAFVDAADAEIFQLFLEDVFRTRQQLGMEFRLQCQGIVAPVRMEAIAVPEQSAGVLRARIAIIDLSALRAADERRRVSQSRYRHLVAALPIGLLVLDRDWQLVDVNDAAAALLDRDELELRDQHLLDLLPDATDSAWFSCLERVMNERQPERVTTEYTFRPKQPPGWYEIQAFPVREGVCVLITDATSRYRATRALAEREELFRAVVTAAVDAIITIDDRGTIESFNPAAERMFGYGAADVVGRNIGILMPWPRPETYDDYLEHHGRTKQGRVTGTGRELEGLRKDGTAFPIHLRITEAQIGGQTRFCGYIRDLTVSKRLERELRHAQKMEAVGTLASGVAHDFNNLLMGVSGCASIALNAIAPSNPAHMYVEEIKRSVDNGAAITRQLLAFSRRRDEQPAVFELNRLVANQRAILSRLLGEDVTIVTQLDARDSRVRLDPGQVEQILMNLAINARDAMPAGGTVTIETAAADPPPTSDETAAKGSWVRLSVRDTGMGMDADTLNHVFEPFYTTKAIGRGTGLGLSTVYGIVNQVGGHIQVDSAPGNGTSFSILLPRASDHITKDLPAVPLTCVAHDETVLLVEDDLTVRMALRHYLQEAGYRVLEAGSGTEAVACARNYKDPVHLLITDIILPGGHGAEVARLVRELKPNVRCLFMSAHDRAVLEDKGELQPGMTTLHKPFDKARLLQTVHELLSNR